MFSSPSIRLYNSENVDNLVQRKPGNNHLTTRKPFLDRSVNSKTPDTAKLLKSKQTFTKENATVDKPKISPKNDLNAEDFMFSYKDIEDTYEDIWPTTRLSTEKIITILRNYCSMGDTPEPEDLNPISFEFPEIDMELQKFNEDLFDNTFGIKEVIDVEDVEVPELDYDDLDASL